MRCFVSGNVCVTATCIVVALKQILFAPTLLVEVRRVFQGYLKGKTFMHQWRSSDLDIWTSPAAAFIVLCH